MCLGSSCGVTSLVGGHVGSDDADCGREVSCQQF